MSKVLIVAPHVDDEMIGCWSVIKSPENQCTVYYCFELSDVRKAEARSVCANFDMDYRFFDEAIPDPEKYKADFDRIYIPSRKDWHKAHREVNARWRKASSHFYSVDMHNGVPLGMDEGQLKLANLRQFYPSQEALLRSEKYGLFEAISTSDYDLYVTIHTHVGYIECLSEFADPIKKMLVKNLGYFDEDDVLGVCYKGRVKICDMGAKSTKEWSY